MENIMRHVDRAWGREDPRCPTLPAGLAPRAAASRPPSFPGSRHVAPGAAGQTKAIRGASGDMSPSARLRANLRNRA